MRRIDVLGIGIGVFFTGGLVYLLLRIAGIEPLQAGIWSQAIFVLVVLGWLSTYFLRVFTGRMTYHQQLKDYEEAVMSDRLARMSPEELAALEAEILAESSEIADPELGDN
ncbi:DUF3007 family protein [Thermosynechococcus sp. QKsg1]|uniref:DUF3007 family protein n=1 Tax=unclassified Thermosynechococcus TaxID=2622553 RepID=UPI00122E5717|nr:MULTISPECIES: DUF3007 family protein [unclassified Thermosynechococcus]QEQ02022.1 DUF3007 family protein [Thermosynechococcus sp. CL-1]WJI23910.1 DUF3007 family protein [Thermosynechococcus sp. B0]WJI26423.1 DUF3007 family protein [Thermosynechococcus sp. B1]WJI28950.1 DUF3007 family protein [Thermosynechococcus sp. B3]WNC86542.1 DUF3007 family protein [Thermosynechococcus sp. QKsg1]